jgi:peroxiredoxin
MKDQKSQLYLWILLGLLMLMVAAAAIYDQATHAGNNQQAASISAQQDTVKTGWKVGEKATDFLLTTTENRDVRLSDYLGKKVMLNFWAPWCGPCRYEVPIFKSIKDSLAKQEVVILAISTQDTFENTVAFAKYNNLDFIIPVDTRGTVANYYNVRGIPTTFFIDGKGIITSIKIGPFINEDEVMERISSFK